MHLTKDYIKNLFPSKIYVRGERYYILDLVEIQELGEDYLEAEVRGGERYFVQVVEKGERLSYYCSCPYDGACKHLAAALLKALEVRQNSQAELFHPQVATPSWQRYFSQIGETHPDTRGVDRWRLRYELRLERDRWLLQPQKQKYRKDGTWGKPQSISSTDFHKPWVVGEREDKLALSYLEKWRLSDSYNYYYTIRSTRYDFNYGAAAGVLFDLLQNKPVFLQNGQKDIPLDFRETQGRIEFRLQPWDNRFRFSPFLILDDGEAPLQANFTLLTAEPIWLLIDGKLVKTAGKLQADTLLPFAQKNYQVLIAQEQLPNFFASLAAKPELMEAFRFPEGVTTETATEITESRLYLVEVDDGIAVQPRFAYGAVEVDADLDRPVAWAMSDDYSVYVKAKRDFAAEEKAIDRLLATRLKRTAGGVIQTLKNQAFEWMFEDVPKLLQEGFAIYGEENLQKFKVNRSAPRVNVNVKSGIDWFDLNIEIDIDGILLSLKEVKKALKKKSKYVKLADGSVAALPEEWLDRFGHAVSLGEHEENRVRLSHFHITLIDELFAQASYDSDHGYREKLERLTNFNGIEKQALPEALKGELRPYQYEGYNWLHFLKEYGFGGCLADDMGLGKTIQALSLLLAEKANGNEAPSLIVCPTSVVFNWMNEIKRFAPDLRALRQTGTERQRLEVNYDDYDVVLTSYGTLRQDIVFLKDVEFNYVILDESQYIKNPLSQTAKATKLLRARRRLALTGTPIENNTIELWSLFSFLNPGLLGSLNYFKNAFAKPIEKQQDEQTATLLRKTVYPFILRRTKDKVATELPPKVENIILTEMEPAQKKIYNKWRDYYRAALLSQISDVGLDKTRMNVLEGLTRLRQIACHPILVEDVFAGSVGKYDTLIEYLDEITAEGHKVLVFSQFVRMLSIIRRYLDSRKTPYAYLDGRTRDREACVARFQQDDTCKIFLISLKAGGTGLNLTSADYVIHYDPWWNPAVESQATDRTHRIGQDKHVFVYKLITKGTVEEKILQLQEQKKELVSNIISTDQSLFKQLTVDDIKKLFS